MILNDNTNINNDENDDLNNSSKQESQKFFKDLSKKEKEGLFLSKQDKNDLEKIRFQGKKEIQKAIRNSPKDRFQKQSNLVKIRIERIKKLGQTVKIIFTFC